MLLCYPPPALSLISSVLHAPNPQPDPSQGHPTPAPFLFLLHEAPTSSAGTQRSEPELVASSLRDLLRPLVAPLEEEWSPWPSLPGEGAPRVGGEVNLTVVLYGH